MRVLPAPERNELLCRQTLIHPAPSAQNSVCWTCLGGFEGAEAPSGVRLPARSARQTIGLFCSFACAKRYAADRRVPKASEHLFNMCRATTRLPRQVVNAMPLAERVRYDDRCRAIVPAPPQSTLQCFGGPYTVEEYRAQSVRQHANTQLALPCTYENPAVLVVQHRPVVRRRAPALHSPSRRHAEASST